MSSSECLIGSEEDAETVAIVFCIFALLLGLVLILSKALHDRPKLNQYLSEPAMILIVGIMVGYVFSLGVNDESSSSLQQRDYYNNKIDDFYAYDDENEATEDQELEEVARSMLHFSPHVFYLGLLPPILYHSGYELERDMFMRHFKPIALFAVLGTTISGFGTGFLLYLFQSFGWFKDFTPSLLELLTFGALIAATDTVSVLGVLQTKRVDPHLFSLVFGESALNDGVAIVLFKTLADILEAKTSDPMSSAKIFLRDIAIAAIGSPIMGIAFSYLLALVYKFVDFRQQPIIELSLLVLLMYVPFVLAEILHLSGIVGIFFAGMSARRYITPNLSTETQHNAKVIFKLVAYLAEACIFLHVGLSIFGFEGHFQWEFIGFALIAALAGRAMSIYPISILFNFSLKKRVKEPLLGEGDVCDNISVGSSASTVSNASSKSSASRLSGWRRRKTPESRRDKQIPWNFMHILWFAGLRGAVAYSCAVNFPDVNGNRDYFVAATIIIVLVTIIIMGGAAEFMIRKMGIRVGVDEKEYMKEWRKVRKLKGCFHSLERKYLLRTALRDYQASKRDLPTNPYQVPSNFVCCVPPSSSPGEADIPCDYVLSNEDLPSNPYSMDSIMEASREISKEIGLVDLEKLAASDPPVDSEQQVGSAGTAPPLPASESEESSQHHMDNEVPTEGTTIQTDHTEF